MQCQAITASKTRCKRTVLSNTNYCWQHQDSKSIAPETKQSIKIPQTNLLTLPTDIFTNIGEYTTLEEISKLRTLGAPKSLYIHKK